MKSLKASASEVKAAEQVLSDLWQLKDDYESRHDPELQVYLCHFAAYHYTEDRSDKLIQLVEDRIEELALKQMAVAGSEAEEFFPETVDELYADPVCGIHKEITSQVERRLHFLSTWIKELEEKVTSTWKDTT